MAKRSSPILGGTVQAAQDKLSELLKEADPGLGSSDGELSNRPSYVPENMPLMATEASKSSAAIAAAAGNSETMAIAGKYDAQYAGTLRNLEDAMHHTEKISTVHTNIGVGHSAISMPATVRDIPNALYTAIGHDRQHHYVREKADKLLTVLFGDLAPRVQQGAQRSGFAQKPLVWVSQSLWFKLFTATDTLDDLTFNSQFNPDEASDHSTVKQALGLCLEPMTIAQLIRFAKNSPGSVLDVLRGIVGRILDEIGVTVPTKEQTAEQNEQIQANRRPL